MIGSSMLSFGGTHDLNPKYLRQCLYIPEDQLKILNSLPEWSKEEPASNADRLIKGTESTILISQASHLETEVTQSKHKKNLETFNKFLITESLYSFSSSFGRKRHKSDQYVKDFELQKDFLKDTLNRSNSDLNLNKNCDKLSVDSAKVSEELYPDSLRKKLSTWFSSKSTELFVSSDKSANSNTMEVVLPVNVSCLQKEVSAISTEALNTVTVQLSANQISSVSVNKAADDENLKKSTKQTDSENLKTSLGSQISEASLQNKAAEKTFQSLVGITQVNNTPVYGEVDKKNENFNSFGSASKSGISSSQPKPMGVDQNIVGKQVEIDNAAQNVPDSSSASEKNSVRNQSVELGEKDKTLNDSKVIVEPAMLAKTNDPVKVKRKSDSKKHSKRLRSLEKKERSSRSLKNASNITYSKEEIDIMLDLLKQFL